MEFHNYYMVLQKYSLVEFHDIDFFVEFDIMKLWSSTIGGAMIITFLGHSSLNNCENLLIKVTETILENTKEDENILFLCGGYGDFDNVSLLACHEVKEKRPNSEIAFVTPYLKNLTKNELYDTIIYPSLENIHPRYAISKRNEWMVEKADLVIAYVKYTYGGAYKTMLYTQRKKKQIINLAN